MTDEQFIAMTDRMTGGARASIGAGGALAAETLNDLAARANACLDIAATCGDRETAGWAERVHSEATWLIEEISNAAG